jgi:hypothetical protein
MTSTTTEEFMIYGLQVGHGCDDCEQLIIAPAAIHTAGGNYELVASITAGHKHAWMPQEGSVNIRAEDIPAVIAELQKIHDQAVLAEAEQHIPAEWPIHD